ncbi:hypothetical protein JR316_0008204 [Psilocybe cubensis]|uniref:Uncharacterized protein n=1 Tax=Psilocybe cubensis TaxID=181762 RepID=A0ACB8GVW8_PSICU|nr:hypothetical protein JR316_0008204 [Psilocybe cubensis]KAH9479609.1 hypothetical protein JR316_0008204 [Psilocybe cubensis]
MVLLSVRLRITHSNLFLSIHIDSFQFQVQVQAKPKPKSNSVISSTLRGDQVYFHSSKVISLSIKRGFHLRPVILLIQRLFFSALNIQLLSRPPVLPYFLSSIQSVTAPTSSTPSNHCLNTPATYSFIPSFRKIVNLKTLSPFSKIQPVNDIPTPSHLLISPRNVPHSLQTTPLRFTFINFSYAFYASSSRFPYTPAIQFYGSIPFSEGLFTIVPRRPGYPLLTISLLLPFTIHTILIYLNPRQRPPLRNLGEGFVLSSLDYSFPGRAGTGLRQIHDISHAKISVSPIVTSGLHAVTIRGTAREVGDALSAIGKRIAHRCIRNPRSKKPKQPPAPTAAPPTLVVEPPSSTPTSSSTPTTRTPRSGTASPHLPIPTAVDTRSSPSSSFAPGLPMEVDALRAPQQHSDGYSRPGPVQPREGIQTARRGGGPPCVFGANRPR